MDIVALIELLQTHLPEELTPEQIAEIRAKLADNPELQEALLEELSLEQGLATKYAPAVTDFDEVISRIESLAAARQRKHWLMLALAGGLVLVLLSVTITLVRGPRRPERDSAPVVVAAAGPARGPVVPVVHTHPATAPTTRVADGELPGWDEPGKVVAGTSTTGPAHPGVPAAGFPMTWREFALQESDWRGHVEKLFDSRSGKKAALSRDRKYLELDGTYRLGAVPSPGRMLRLGVWEGRQFELESWRGNDGIRLQIEPNEVRIRAYVLRRRNARSEPTITDSFDDRGAWRWYGRGAIDLRYQDAQLLVCRGEVPLLRVPMPGPPASSSLKASRVRLWLAEARACRKLALPVERIDKTSVTSASAGKLIWEKKPEDKMELATRQRDVVALSGEQEHDIGRAWFTLDAPQLTGLEATIHVRECTPSAGMFARVGDSYLQVRIDSHGGKRVVGRGDRRQMDEDLRTGRTVGDEFWIRFRFGLDVMMVWISPDGRNWWPRGHQAFQGRTDQLQIGLEIHQGKGPRRVAVGDITIRRFESVRRMVGAEAGLVAKAKSALTDEVLLAGSREQALAILDKARGKDVEADKWRTACDVNLASRSRSWEVRRDAIRELFLAPCYRADTDVEAVLAAVEELLDITCLEKGELPGLTHDVFDGLGRYCLEAGKIRMLKTVMDASYLRPGSMGLPRILSSSSVGVPPGLLRLYLLDLMARGEWESVRVEAMRAMFIAHSRERRDSLPLARWAAAEAHARLGDKSDPDAPEITATRRRALVIHDDREILNIMGEFVFLVRGKHYESACKTITSRMLPDALVSLGGEEDLLQSSHFRVREIIRTTPQLREILKQRYSGIGMIRLERARRQNDLEALKSLAVQFYGTTPGFGAMHVLADRDLSNGNFYGAADWYRLLQDEQDYPQRTDAAAKFRLASAMLGNLVGEPVEQTVVLPGGTFSPREFEQMVRRLASERKSRSVTVTAAVDAPAPRGTGAHLTCLADVPGGETRSSSAQARPTAFAVDGDRLVVSHANTLFAVDRKSRRILWLFQPDRKHRRHSQRSGYGGAVRPLRIGDKLYTRCDQDGQPLACFEIRTGKVLWRKTYNDLVLSDPIVIGSWLYVITARYDTTSALHLHRVSPDTGESSLSSPLVQVLDQSPAIGRPMAVGNAILFRTSGCLVNCDLRGTVRWARRLPFVPVEVLPELHAGTDLGDMLVWQDKNAIFPAPGCPYIMCVDSETGKMLWSFMTHSPARLVGLVAGSVVVAESDRVCALDPATGKVRWQRRLPMDDTGILPAEKDTLVLVRLGKQHDGRKDTSHRSRYVRWISARDGRAIKELPIDGDSAIYGVSKLFSDGKRLFGLSGFGAGKPRGKVFEIEIRG